MELTFGEQVKVILSRRGMTIKRLAELVEEHTGKPMSRQNMTQRLGRDNFQEQDMRMIAEILGCELQLSLVEPGSAAEEVTNQEAAAVASSAQGETVESIEATVATRTTGAIPSEEKKPSGLTAEMKEYFKTQALREKEEAPAQVGDINPYTGKEYETNSVRKHPKRIGYVQVYSQDIHAWTDMTEWAYLGEQERKKVALGKEYKPPIYMD